MSVFCKVVSLGVKWSSNHTQISLLLIFKFSPWGDHRYFYGNKGEVQWSVIGSSSYIAFLNFLRFFFKDQIQDEERHSKPWVS